MKQGAKLEEYKKVGERGEFGLPAVEICCGSFFGWKHGTLACAPPTEKAVDSPG